MRFAQALELAARFDPEDDPITREQIEILAGLLHDDISREELEGYLIFCSRFVEESGWHRTEELSRVFRTHTGQGVRCLRASLAHMYAVSGGVTNFRRRYPVSIIPPRPVFPVVRIIGLDTIIDKIYRVLDSRACVHGTGEPVLDHVLRTGRLPQAPRQRRPARRSKPRMHWCSYEQYDSPELTRQSLQILESWSDCQLRATIDASRVKRACHVAFNGDRENGDCCRGFNKYFFEAVVQDHPPMPGGGTQIVVEGAPVVRALERWSEGARAWEPVFGEL